MPKKKPVVVPKKAEQLVRVKQPRGGVEKRPLHDCPIIVRLTKHERDVVNLAAEYEGRSTAYFAADCIVDKAYEVLRRRERELLNEGKAGLA